MQLNLKQNQCIALEGKNNKPICQKCLENEVNNWLKIRKPNLLPELKNKTKIFFSKSSYSNHIPCSLCNKHINICDFCFREHIKKWLKDKYPRLLQEFKLFFSLHL